MSALLIGYARVSATGQDLTPQRDRPSNTTCRGQGHGHPVGQQRSQPPSGLGSQHRLPTGQGRGGGGGQLFRQFWYCTRHEFWHVCWGTTVTAGDPDER